MSNQSFPNNSQSSSRWWEYYLARYLLPSITGALIVLWLTKPYFCLYFNENPFKKSTFYITLLLLGFAYCYIASFPALVFHSIREIFFNKSKVTNKNILNKYPCAITIIFLIAFSTVIAIPFTLELFNSEYFIIEKYYQIILLITFLIFSGIQVAFIIFGKSTQFDYLMLLSDHRAKSTNDITDSYRHLREHGNTGLIFILEILLAIPCYTILTGNYEFKFQFLIAISVIWSLPGACVYFLGQYFEYRFATDKKEDSLPG
jgi:hypothetical protein